MMAPANVSLLYLCGTFGVFLIGRLVPSVQDFPILILFVAASFLALYVGFLL